MTYILSKREVSALENVEFESRYLEGDFAVKSSLGPGVGNVTLSRLLELGLIEYGFSNHHREPGYRITEDGERCLNGGLTSAEVMSLPPDRLPYTSPKVKSWPPGGAPVAKPKRKKLSMLPPRTKPLDPPLKR